jgi:glycosyltransferase involved in cell wall biosynthesis
MLASSRPSPGGPSGAVEPRSEPPASCAASPSRRILLISNTSHDPNKGSGYVITRFIDGLRARGHTVDAFELSDYLTVATPKGWRYVAAVQAALFGLQKTRDVAYDVVELWGAETWLLAWLLNRQRRRSFAIVHHSNGIEPHLEARLRAAARAGLVPAPPWYELDLSPLHRAGIRASDAVVTVGAFDASYLRAEGLAPEDRVASIDNALPDDYLGLPLRLGRPRRIGFCGTWIPRKGTALLQNDIPTFLREWPEWTFSLVGAGAEEEVLAGFPPDVHARIEVIPFLPRADLRAWYQSLAVLVAPSVYESFGLVQAEAMACGVAVVATPVGFAAALEHRKTVLHTSGTSPDVHAQLAALARDESLRRHVAQGGYRAVQSLRWDRSITQMESVYATVCPSV